MLAVRREWAQTTGLSGTAEKQSPGADAGKAGKLEGRPVAAGFGATGGAGSAAAAT